MNPTRIVIADDHAVVRDGIANTLKELPGVKIVAQVGNGRELFATLAQVQPDCLLLDTAMPDFLPVSDVHLIRARYPDMKILVISAYDEDVYVQGMLAAGVNGYHLKDQPLDDLRLAVQRILSGERWVCSPLVEKLLRRQAPVGTATHLTARQSELLLCLKQGLDNQAIARFTSLSIKTVENHLTHLYRLLNVQSRLEAVAYVTQHPEMLASSELNPAGGAWHPMPAGHQLDILIVDENLRYRMQLRRMISRAAPQARIYEVEHIQAAMDLARDIALQLAFVDVALGDENGIECVRLLREQSHQTRVVLLSAYPDRILHQQARQAGAVAFLEKCDLNAAAMREIINEATG